MRLNRLRCLRQLLGLDSVLEVADSGIPVAIEEDLSPDEQLCLAAAILRLRVSDEVGAGDRRAKHRIDVLARYRKLLVDGGQFGLPDARGRLLVERPAHLSSLLARVKNQFHAAMILVEVSVDNPWGKVPIAPEVRLSTIWDLADMFSPSLPEDSVTALEAALLKAQPTLIRRPRLGAVSKGILVSLTGVTATTLAAPAIGTAIGVHLLGLSGAAATSAGLAVAGGGSVVSGGLGMAGGTAIISAAGSAAVVGSVANKRLRRFLTGVNASVDTEMLKAYATTSMLRELPQHRMDFLAGLEAFRTMERELEAELARIESLDEKDRKLLSITKDRLKTVRALIRELTH